MNKKEMEKEIIKMYDALDIIAKYEDGDSIHLKRNIRAARAKLEEELELADSVSVEVETYKGVPIMKKDDGTYFVGGMDTVKESFSSITEAKVAIMNNL